MARQAKSISLSLRALSRLLGYPDAELRLHLPDLKAALHSENAVGQTRLAELDALIDALSAADGLDVEAAYVELFDRGRSTALHLFEHVHGDSRERGPALIDLAQTYESAGLYLAPDELPDYLPAVLEFVSTQPPCEARAFLGETAHILNALFTALQQRRSAYASAIGALLELAGEQARAVNIAPDEALDDTWMEPQVFDGCSSGGQRRPKHPNSQQDSDADPQPIHIVRKDAAKGALA